MNFQDALSYVQGVRSDFCVPGTERVAALCRLLGDPQKKLSAIHVTGTNGKGSVCAMLAAILTAAGYRVGSYTSPHMLSFRERIRVDGVDISEDDFVSLTEKVHPYVENMADKPTEFELVTAMAFSYFLEKKCDLVIVEVGLGGALDATNVIESPVCSVITGVGMDHTVYLGDTIEKITAHKAGIIKKGRPAVLGKCSSEVYKIIEKKAKSCLSAVHRVDPAELVVHKRSMEGTDLSYKSFSHVQFSLIGSYQTENCATVLECIRVLSDQGYTVSEQAIRRGLSHVVWHGRFEVICREPLVIYDGGHNLDGAHAFVDSLAAVLPAQKVCLVCGILKDKEYEKMVSVLSPVAEKAFAITIDSPRALPAETLASIFARNGVEAVAPPTTQEALKVAFSYACTNHIPLVMNGSLYMYADVMAILRTLL